MNTRTWIFSHLLFGLLAGCAGNTLQVQSQPDGADVFLIAQDGSSTKVGKTPLTIDARTNPSLLSGATQIRVAKDGYLAQSAMVPSLGFLGASAALRLNLSETELPKVCSMQDSALNDLAKGLAEGSALMQKRRLDEAIQLLKNLSLKFPSIAVIYDLLGNSYYLQKDLDRALDAYKHSNTLEPNNSATLKMIAKIQMVQGTLSRGDR